MNINLPKVSLPSVDFKGLALKVKDEAKTDFDLMREPKYLVVLALLVVFILLVAIF